MIRNEQEYKEASERLEAELAASISIANTLQSQD